MSRKIKDFLPKNSKERCIWLIILAIALAIAMMVYSVVKGTEHVGYSVIDVCAVLVAFVSSCVSIHLTLEINRLAEQNRKEEEKKTEHEKHYAQIHAQAASFPQFKIDTCIVYDMDKLLTMKGDEFQTISDYVRNYKPTAQRKYLLKIGSQEAFPAYYKVGVKAVNLLLQTDRGTFAAALPEECCWVTNNEQFFFWINFDDQNSLVEELKEAVNVWIPGEKVCLEIEVEFSCVNVLLESNEKSVTYRVKMDCLARNGMLNPNVQIELKVEHRYLSRMST